MARSIISVAPLIASRLSPDGPCRDSAEKEKSDLGRPGPVGGAGIPLQLNENSE